MVFYVIFKIHSFDIFEKRADLPRVVRQLDIQWNMTLIVHVRLDGKNKNVQD